MLVGATGLTAPARAQDAPPVTMRTAEASTALAYGDEVAFSGELAPAVEGAVVTLEYAASEGAFAPVAETTTAADGTFAFLVRPEFSGLFRAVGPGGASDAAPVTVHARLVARTRHDVRRDRPAYVYGRLLPARSGRTVLVERRISGGWARLGSAATRSDGTFSARWTPTWLGGRRVRVRFGGDALNATSVHLFDRPVYAYRLGLASWYGPGFFGRRTGCGQILRPWMLGVAHKTLPCGTSVRFRYGGRTITVKVIDRGPYVGAREFDLTEPTARALGFTGVRYVWATR